MSVHCDSVRIHGARRKRKLEFKRY